MTNLPKQDEERQAECCEAPQKLDQLSPEVQQRLRSAARILATGAIRAAAKQAQNADPDSSTGSS